MPDESEQTPYYVAARFRDEEEAERTYFRIQNYVQRHPSQLDLSVYRFFLPGESGDSIVAVLGEDPGAEVGRRLERALSAGEMAILDEQTLEFLQQRREMSTEQGPWVERHYRPGRGFNLDR